MSVSVDIEHSPDRLSVSVSSAGIAVHHDVLVPSGSILLRRRWRHVSRHARHQSLRVLALGRRPVGRVAGLLCEGMASLLAELCGLLLLLRQTMCADVCLPCGRCVAGFGQAFFGVPEFGLELFEFGGFGVEGLLSVRGLDVNGFCLFFEAVERNAKDSLLVQGLGDVVVRGEHGAGALGSHLACGKTKHAIKVCGKALGDRAGWDWSAWSFAIARECCIRLGTWWFAAGHDCGWRCWMTVGGLKSRWGHGRWYSSDWRAMQGC